MALCKKKEEVVTTTTYQLVLTQEEAQDLIDLLYRMRGNTRIIRTLSYVFSALVSAGLQGRTSSNLDWRVSSNTTPNSIELSNE